MIQSRHTRERCIALGLVLGAVAALSGAGCLANPQRAQSNDLLTQLVSARGMFVEQPPRAQDGCDVVGNVQQRLSYEPGVSDVRPAWSALSDAAEALQAVCGQSTLLGQPSNDSLAVREAHQRWQQAIQREIGVACEHLRAAAVSLDRSAPC